MELISCKDVTKTYQSGDIKIDALKNINLEIFKSQFISFIGPSGSGKTTLLNLFGCLDKPTRGTVKIMDQDISDLNYIERARFRGKHLGFIFQNFNLLPVLTVFENVEYPLIVVKSMSKEARKEKVLSLLDSVGMLDQKDKMISQISGGQKQRAAIARALATDPSIVLADEPTANLDHVSAYKVMDLMRQLSRDAGTTFIFATHDNKIVQEVDIVYTIEDGILTNKTVNSNRSKENV